MALCRDPALSYLNSQGYNVVRLPRKGIEPLDVLGKDGCHMERLGRLLKIWRSDAKTPQVSVPQPAVGINGRQTAQLKTSIGLKLLGDILEGLGATRLALNAAYAKASSVQIVFADVEVVSIDPFDIGNYLASGDLDTRNPFVTRYFEDDDTNVYVIFETLRSRKIVVIAKNDSGHEIAPHISDLANLVEGDVTISRDSQQKNRISYAGSQPLTFGFKVFGLAYCDGNWRVEGIAPSPDLAFDITSVAGSVVPSTMLSRSGGRVVLK